uniref:heat shock protein 30C-like n=1 Tax=Pristiophorus japonicus TaxID=55135 RepID=UPI00398F2FF0
MLSCRAVHPSRLCQQPVCTLWPVPHTVFEPFQCNRWEQEEEVRKIMNFMNRVLGELAKEFWEGRPKYQDNRPDDNEDGKSQSEGKDGDGFSLSLDVQRFSPEELKVYSYKYEEFRREFQLPEDVDAQALNCCLSQDGRLKVQAPRLALPAVNGRTVPINITSDTTTAPRLNPGKEAQKQDGGKDERNKKEAEAKKDI